VTQVPVEEIERIESGLAPSVGWPRADLFFTAQVIALNHLTEIYYSMLDEPSGNALLQRVGWSAARLFEKAKMPPAPVLASEAEYRNMW
jgi:hypothetical protein